MAAYCIKFVQKTIKIPLLNLSEIGRFQFHPLHTGRVLGVIKRGVKITQSKKKESFVP